MFPVSLCLYSVQVHSHFNNCMDQMDIVKSRLGPMASHLSLGQVLETLWRDSSSEVEGLKAAEALFQWHCANLEFANACRLNDISLTLWDQDDIYEMQGAHVFAMGDALPLGWREQVADNISKAIQSRFFRALHSYYRA